MSVLSAMRIRYEPIRSLAFGSISGSYTAVGSTFSNPVRILKVTNLTNSDLLISFDGTTDFDVVASGGFYLYDYGSNKADAAGNAEQSSGELVYVKSVGSAPSEGSVYVTVIYLSKS